MEKLNLGCGQDYREGWINVDISNRDIYNNTIKIDIKQNLEKYPWPFKNDQFDVVLIKHVFEHIKDKNKFLKELIRISKPKSQIRIIVPHFTFYGEYRDPTHISNATIDSICYYSEGFRVINKTLNYSNFLGLNQIGNFLINLNPRIYERFFCWIFPCQECVWDLEVTKKRENNFSLLGKKIKNPIKWKTK